MNFDTVIRALNDVLTKEQPKILNSSWIYRNTPSIYRFIWAKIKTETGEVDWDAVTSCLDRTFQKRWVRRKSKRKEYENKTEVDLILSRHRQKLYVFVVSASDEDKRIRDVISIALVRLAQRGNLSARMEITERIQDTIDEWIENDLRITFWRGYDDLLQNQIEGCIRRYRYSGSFIRYLYRTLECAGRGLRPLVAFSLNSELPDGKKTFAENVVKDLETGTIQIF